MEAIGDIQETYNIWSWLLPLISGAIGALIGTYGGSYFLHWKQEKKIKNVRAMAVKALNVFRAYAKKSYIDTANEFNNKLNISEKRAVVVALHKIGVPFEISTKDDFDIKDAPNTIVSQPDWHKVFSPGELQIIFVLRIQLANTAYFLPDGNADPVKMKTLIREIEIGLWDNYLFWEYESYQNIRAQHNLANIIQNAVGQQMMNTTIKVNDEKDNGNSSIK